MNAEASTLIINPQNSDMIHIYSIYNSFIIYSIRENILIHYSFIGV